MHPLNLPDYRLRELRVGVPFGPGCHSFGAEPSFTVSGIAGIPDAGEVKGRRETLAGGRPDIGGDPSVTNAIQTNQTKQTQFTSTGPNNSSDSAPST